MEAFGDFEVEGFRGDGFIDNGVNEGDFVDVGADIFVFCGGDGADSGGEIEFGVKPEVHSGVVFGVFGAGFDFEGEEDELIFLVGGEVGEGDVKILSEVFDIGEADDGKARAQEFEGVGGLVGFSLLDSAGLLEFVFYLGEPDAVEDVLLELGLGGLVVDVQGLEIDAEVGVVGVFGVKEFAFAELLRFVFGLADKVFDFCLIGFEVGGSFFEVCENGFYGVGLRGWATWGGVGLISGGGKAGYEGQRDERSDDCEFCGHKSFFHSLLGCIASGFNITDIKHFFEFIDGEVGVFGEVLFVVVVSEPDGEGTGGSCAEEVEKIVAYDDGFAGFGIKAAAEFEYAEGVGLYGSFSAAVDFVEAEAGLCGDGEGVGLCVAGEDAYRDAATAKFHQGAPGAGVES